MNFMVLNMIFMKICWTLILWTKYTIDCSCTWIMFASNRFLCLILNNKFTYIWEGWYTGEKHRIYLEDAIAYKEKADMDKIKLNDCSVCLKWFFFFCWIHLVSLTKIFLYNVVYIFLTFKLLLEVAVGRQKRFKFSFDWRPC